MMIPLTPIPEDAVVVRKRKRRRVDRDGVANQAAYLESLPCAQRYESSYMHRDVVTHVVVAPVTDFVATASRDGHVKFWKKMKQGIEFVKHYHAHVGPITCVAVSADGQWLCSAGVDGAAKLYDVSGFDMVCIIRTNAGDDAFVCGAACWIHGVASPRARVALADSVRRGPVRVYGAPTFSLVAKVDVHSNPIACMRYVAATNVVISADVKGFVEYWRADDDASGRFDDDDDFVAKSDVALTRPTLPSDVVRFRLKVETDLFELAKRKAVPCCIEASRDGARFSITAKDAKIRIFDFATGKLLRTLDESLESLGRLRRERAEVLRRHAAAAEATAEAAPGAAVAGEATDDEGDSDNDSDDDDGPQPLKKAAATTTTAEAASTEAPTAAAAVGPPPAADAWTEAVCALDEMAYGRRSAVEADLQSSQVLADGSKPAYSRWNAAFDETGHFVVYAALLGAKVVNIASAEVAAVVSRDDEGERFVSVALFEGAAKVDEQMEQARAAARGEEQALTLGAEQGAAASSFTSDPTLFLTAFKRKRFYLVTRREPDEEGDGVAAQHPRDVMNEMPTAEDLLARLESSSKAALPTEATLRTTMGDIKMKLFATECPRTVENFTTHATNGYYDNLIFHRIIKSFMLQTGDPEGNGTGGESIWGGEFEDEFHPALKHDRPFTVSMANAGPNTNGSQFFITTVPTPWLDGKHTVFGRVTSGVETCTAIENVKTDRFDKPHKEITILSIDLN